jgi:hypothetical protein
MTISKLAELPRLEQSLVDEALQSFASNVATNLGYADDIASFYGASVGEVVRAARTNAEVVREP